MKKQKNIANLKRLDGIEIINEFVDLLIDAGVCSVKDLASRNPDNLFNKFDDLSEITLDSIKNVIDNAKKLNQKDKKYSIATERYFSLINRSFDKYLNLFLYTKLPFKWKESNDTSILDFNIQNDILSFEVNSNKIFEYKNIYQDMAGVRKRNKLFTEWKNKHKEDVQKINDNYFNDFNNKFNLETFKKFYGRDNSLKNRKCHYCGISEEQIKLLIDNNLITTKRLYNRGRTLEVDQKEPDKGYKKDNIVLCCYWCNNAKTDEFSEIEFLEIAEKIKEVWQKRLDKINKLKISD